MKKILILITLFISFSYAQNNQAIADKYIGEWKNMEYPTVTIEILKENDKLFVLGMSLTGKGDKKPAVIKGNRLYFGSYAFFELDETGQTFSHNGKTDTDMNYKKSN